MADIGEMMTNYNNYEEIEDELRENGLDWYVKFNNNGVIEFFRCEFCDGPTLGHSTIKCQQLGDSYDDKIRKSFENWVERSTKF